jgi:uncharacterized oligopeptide transporter (OPT) family protein
LKLPAENLFAMELSAPYTMDEKYDMPAAVTWKAVADVLAEGIHRIKPTARYAALAGILICIALEVSRIVTKNRFPLSAVALGLGFIIKFNTCFSMFMGSFLFWMAAKLFSDKNSRINQVIIHNQEPICAGLIAGGALMGIAVKIAELFLPAAH